jgi:hypothetical protein
VHGLATPLERNTKQFFGAENVPTPKKVVGIHPLDIFPLFQYKREDPYKVEVNIGMRLVRLDKNDHNKI